MERWISSKEAWDTDHGHGRHEKLDPRLWKNEEKGYRNQGKEPREVERWKLVGRKLLLQLDGLATPSNCASYPVYMRQRTSEAPVAVRRPSYPV